MEIAVALMLLALVMFAVRIYILTGLVNAQRDLIGAQERLMKLKEDRIHMLTTAIELYKLADSHQPQDQSDDRADVIDAEFKVEN